LLAGSVPLWIHGLGTISKPGAAIDAVLTLVLGIGAACALTAAYQAKFHRFFALILLGCAGLATCVSFVFLRAPDLALTQLVVETVTTVLLLLGLRWLPKRVEFPMPPRIRWYRASDLALAVAVGVGLATLTYAVLRSGQPASISAFFSEHAYTGGGGTNIVNVILVDFRAFDTFGEITVLCVVALTVYALLRRFRPSIESLQIPQQQHTRTRKSLLVPELLMGMLFPVIGAVSVFLLLRGHDLPGGGFVAGVTMAVAFVLQYMARGTVWVEKQLRVLPVKWMGIGLLLAAGMGCAPALLGRPFLTSSFTYAEIPLIGAVPLATAMVFDLGVFGLVVGAVVLMLIAIAHQSVRGRRADIESHASGEPGERRWN
jgi:multicomponent K+:H+ antiporter subunit A